MAQQSYGEKDGRESKRFKNGWITWSDEGAKNLESLPISTTFGRKRLVKTLYKISKAVG